MIINNNYPIQNTAWKRWFWCFLPLVSLLFTLTAHSAPVTRYIHTDPMGSPIAATDENGEILWVEDYKPYGERIRKEEKSAPHKRWYTGHVQDDDTGLIYMGARYYDPHIGRFLSPDPVGFDASNPVSFNKYAYANNNPYRYVDPDGRVPVPLIIYGVYKLGSIALDGASFTKDVASGNYAGAAITAVGSLDPSGLSNKVKKLKKLPVFTKVHGNSKVSTKEQHLYMIEDADGNIKKVGVSGQNLNKNGTSPRANSQLNNGDTATVLESGIPGRANVLQKEGQAVEGLRKAGHELPDQKRPKI